MYKFISLLFIVSFSVLMACNPTVHKTESGLEYIVIPGNKGGPQAATGSTVKLHYSQLFHDTVTASTFDKMPYYKALIPGTIFAYDPFEVLAHGVREGDSIVVTLRMDSLVSKGKIAKLPPHILPTDKIITSIKVLKVFPFDIMHAQQNDSLIYLDKTIERKRIDSIQTIIGPKRVQEYLTQQKITATPTAAGAYLQVLNAGTGALVDTGKLVFLQYKVSTLKGKVMDTNMDTTFHHTNALTFEVGTEYMMKPVDEAIRGLKKDGHAKIYIPAMVAASGNTQGMENSYDDIIFEVIVLEVKEK